MSTDPIDAVSDTDPTSADGEDADVTPSDGSILEHSGEPDVVPVVDEQD